MSRISLPIKIELQQFIEQSRQACLACSSAMRVDDHSVYCGSSKRREEFKRGRCRQRKWPTRPGVPGLPGVWVLSSPRTGSYYLCAILNRVGFNPPLKEWYHQEIKRRESDPPRNTKIHTFQLGHRGASIQSVMKEYPDTRFIVLRRRDHVACAVSNYIGTFTHMLLVTSEQQAQVYAGLKPVPFDESRILQIYARVLEEDRFWTRHMDSLNVAYRTVFYEDLETDPVDTIQGIFDYLGILDDPAVCLEDVPNRRQSILRPESKPFIDRLHAMVSQNPVGSKT